MPLWAQYQLITHWNAGRNARLARQHKVGSKQHIIKAWSLKPRSASTMRKISSVIFYAKASEINSSFIKEALYK
jgi:hypothetical protein